VGTVASSQEAPPSRVVSTMPALVTDPLDPTAMQSDLVGQEIPLRSGAVPASTCWAVQVRPPLAVAAIAVAARPTAQQ
jgi:hypothetical protein